MTQPVSDTPTVTSAPERRAGSLEDLDKWQAEVLRLEEVIAMHEREKAELVWFLKVGVVLIVPSYFLHHKLGPAGVLLFALSGYFCGHYFVRGHLGERRLHLQLAQEQLRRAEEEARSSDPN